MICKQCGLELEPGVRACPVCGEPTEPEKKRPRALAPLVLVIGFLLLCGCLFAGYRLGTVGTQTAASDAMTETVDLPTRITFVFHEDEQVATRGFLRTDAQTLKAMDDNAFAAFCTSVLRDDCDYFTMYLTDDTGLVFFRKNLSPILYGTLNEDGNIAAILGTIYRDPDGHYVYIPSASPAPPATEPPAQPTVVPTTAPLTEPAGSMPTEEIIVDSTVPTETTAPTPATSVQPPVTAPSTTQPTTAAPAPPASGDTVYVTNSGTKYHRSGCSYLSHSKIAISLSDAKAQGYTPCSRCFQ